MPISFKKPKFQKIQEFSLPSNYEQWIPNLFSESYFGNIFPINSDGDFLDQNFKFINNNVDDFQISMNRYLLFLYCLKSNPFLFTQASSTIDYTKDEFLFTVELSEFLYGIQTNTVKNKLNSSLTIELVKKYALDNQLELIPENLASFLDIAKTQDYIDKISRKLNIVTYESVIKHTLYNKLKENSTYSFNEDSSAGWVEKAASLSYGDTEYFVDIEGGPDNKSFPVVCVLTKSFSKDSKDKIINNSNKFLSEVFGREVTNQCLARIIGTPNQFENNFKQVPILKSKKDSDNYYNSTCIVYDFTKILLSKNIKRKFLTQSIIESSLGFLTKHKIELNNIRDLENLKNKFSDSINKYFNDDSFTKFSFILAYQDKHASEINSRINLEKIQEIKSNISKPITIKKQDLINSFNSYVSNMITEYESKRDQNIYLTPYGESDLKVFLHFDSFYNLLAITSIPTKKTITVNGEYFTPFLFTKNDKKDQISFDLVQTEIEKTFSDNFYTNYLDQPQNTVPNKEKELIDLTGHRLCYITRVLEKQIADNYVGTKKRIIADPKNSSNVLFVDNLNLKEKLKLNIEKDELFEEERFIDKNLEFISLNTTYRENRYQSTALQTLNYYLYTAPTIESGLLSPIIARAENIKKEIQNLANPKENNNFLLSFDDKTESDLIQEREESDLQTFASFHYPVLSLLKNEEIDFGFLGDLPDLPELEIPQEILIVSEQIQAAFSIFKGILAQKEGLNINLQHYALSSLPCYVDLLLLIPEFTKTKNTKDLVLLIFQLIDKLPISDILAALSQDIENYLLKLGQVEQRACFPPPPKINLNADDLLKDLEYLKSLYYNVISEVLNFQGIIPEIPRLPTLDLFQAIMLKIFWFILNLAITWILSFLSKKLKKYLDKFCTIDFNLFELLQDKNKVVDLGFTPKLVADPFGAIAGSGGALDTVELSLDINTLIDLTKKATREFVYNKFADKYFVNKTQERLDEILNFFYEISNVVDAFELSTLLRNVQTTETTNNLIDFIRLSDFTFKDRFLDSESIAELFIFLSEYCDYRFCYDFLANSLEAYAGNICSPQISRKDKIEGDLKSLNGLGQDVGSIIRDQIIDLQKDLDELCAADTNINIDLFKDGPRLLASSLNKVMSLPFSTVIQFQENVIDYELGKDETGTSLTPDQLKLLGDRLFNKDKFVSENFPAFKSDFSTVRSKYYNSVNITQLFRFLEISYLNETTNDPKNDKSVNQVWGSLSVSVKDSIILAAFNKFGDKQNQDIINAKNKIKQAIDNLGITGYSVDELEKIIYRRYISYPLLISEAFYKKASVDDKNFGEGYQSFVYNVDYLRDLVSEIEEDIKNATNIDLQADETLFYSYIDKIKELQ